jgi:hypothetical protein
MRGGRFRGSWGLSGGRRRSSRKSLNKIRLPRFKKVVKRQKLDESAAIKIEDAAPLNKVEEKTIKLEPVIVKKEPYQQTATTNISPAVKYERHLD